MRKSFLQTILHLFYPQRCNGCKRYGIALCRLCLESLPLASTLAKPTDFAVFDYGNKVVRQSVWQFKYYHDASAMRILTRAATPHVAAFIAETVQRSISQPVVLVPIPQHIKKTRLRGYNQSALIATWIAQHIEHSTVVQLLTKTVPTLSQARTKHKSARMKNVAHTMRANASLDSKTIYIVVDDVTTTGATLNEARRALQQNGGKKILSVSIAHGYLSS